MMSQSNTDTPTSTSAPGLGQLVVAGLIGVITLVALNGAVYMFLNPMSIGSETLQDQRGYESFYDGSVALLTLAIPSFLGGLLISKIAGASAARVSQCAFAIAAVVGLVHRFWQVPMVTAHSAHSAFMFYMLRNPLVILAFGSLGGWLGGEFASGRFTLADREPPHLPGLEED